MYQTILVQLQENNIVKIMNALKSLEDNGINYKLIDDPETSYSSTPKNQIKTPEFYKKSLGHKGYSILNLLSEGYTYQQIANEIQITVDGVRYYVKKIFTTLNVTNGRDAVRVFLTEIKQK